MRTFLVAAILTLTLLSGCSGDVPMLTAKQTLPSADDAAAIWADDAALVGALTIELGDDIKAMIRQQIDAAGQEAEDGMTSDEKAMMDAMLSSHDSPGDGKGAFWAYVYTSEAKQAYFVVVVSGQGVEFAQEVDMGWGADMDMGAAEAGADAEPIEGWNLDSDEAADVAMRDDDYRALAGDPKALGVAALGMADGNPYWVLVLVKLGFDEEDWEAEGQAEAPQGGQPAAASPQAQEWEPTEAVVIVDARNGTMIPMDRFDDFQPVGPVIGGVQEAAEALAMEYGSVDGELTVLAPESVQSFSIEQDGHQAIALALEVSNPIVAPVQVIVTDPSGLESTFEVPMAAGLQSRQSVVLDIVPAGDWQVSVSLDPALRNTYTFEWCTDGTGVPSDPFGLSVEVCSEVPGNSGSGAHAFGSGVLDFVLRSAA
jgi:outer membrane murein-binding lipoprotein Lpp